MTTREALEPVSVGIDVSKKFLDVDCFPQRQSWRVPNSPEGHQQLVERLREVAPRKIVLEGTGGYEFDVFLALTLAKLPVFRVNPRQVRDFAKCLGQLGAWASWPRPTDSMPRFSRGSRTSSISPRKCRRMPSWRGSKNMSLDPLFTSFPFSFLF